MDHFKPAQQETSNRLPARVVAANTNFASLFWFRCSSPGFLFHAWVSFWSRNHEGRRFDADFNPSNIKYGEIEQLGVRWEVYGGFAEKHGHQSIFRHWQNSGSPTPLAVQRMDIYDPTNAASAYIIVMEKIRQWKSQRYTAPLGFCLQAIHKGTYNGAPFDLDSWGGRNCRTFAREVFSTVKKETSNYNIFAETAVA